MKCSKCGAELQEGMMFCTSCGTPVPKQEEKSDEEATVLLDPNMQSVAPQQSDVQPQMQHPVTPQMGNIQPQMQQPVTPQMGNVQPQMQQPVTPQMGNVQPQMQHPVTPQMGNVQPQMQQPMTPQMGNVQPQMQQPMGYGQPQMQQPMGYGQPQMQQAMGYGQPQMQQPMGYGQQYGAPKPPRKPLTPKQKKIAIISVVAVAVIAVFFLVVWPIITRAKLQGEYKNSQIDTVAVFDDGKYVVYGDDEKEEIISLGFYEVDKKGNIEFTTLEGDEFEGKFKSDDNKVVIGDYTFKSNDKKEGIDLEYSEDFEEELRDRIETAISSSLAKEDAFNAAYWSYYSIYDFDDNYQDAFLELFLDNLDYENDETLKTMIESDYLYFSISFDSECNADISIDIYDYYYWID
ncbi:MAG: zinc-ribbon domain-containing protein [Wujia sp.]